MANRLPLIITTAPHFHIPVQTEVMLINQHFVDEVDLLVDVSSEEPCEVEGHHSSGIASWF
jgi:hypothetical protein